MANYTTHDGDNKRNYELHAIHLLSVTRFGGGNIKIIAWFFVTCYDLCKETFELLFRFINAYILPESGMHFEPQRWLPEWFPYLSTAEPSGGHQEPLTANLHIEKKIRICYNACRQSEVSSPWSLTTTKTPVRQHWGFLFLILAMGRFMPIGWLPTIYRYPAI